MNPTFGVNQALVEEHFRRYSANPDGVDAQWRAFFDALTPDQRAALIANGSAQQAATNGSAPREAGSDNLTDLAWRTSRLVTAFRSRGHYYAQIDPLGLTNESSTEFAPGVFGITPELLDIQVSTDISELETASPRQIVEHMSRTYCGRVGYEVMHVEVRDERQWLLEAIECTRADYVPDAAFERWVLERLTDAQEMERFIHNQYIGVKRFSLEGLEMVIPMMNHIIDQVGDQGVQDVVVGMAHRGRLNVLVNILGKSQSELFATFEDKNSEEYLGRGDVKYHLGQSADYATPKGNDVNISLCFNPSHLEFVNPVVVGRVRAKMEQRGDLSGHSVCPMLIHGDAAFMGQGVVAETLNLAELEGYKTGGTIHIVLNNQVGFTTSPSDSRSSRYASDVARFLRVPVFHVNAEDVDAMTRVARIAADYRQRFHRDVVIDLVGYRKFGHNEGDEPRFTQPKMYAIIDAKTSVRDELAQRMVAGGRLSAAEDEAMVAERRERMSQALQVARADDAPAAADAGSASDEAWRGYLGGLESSAPNVPTAVDLGTLRELLTQIVTLDEGAAAHNKVRKVYEKRARALEGQLLDWGGAEALAFASLVHEGHKVRAPGRGEVCDFKDNDCDEVVNQGLDCRVYAHSNSTLYLVDPFLGTQTVVSSAPSLWDFDTSADGTLYGVTSGRRLVRFDEASRDWITVGNIGSTSTANGFAIDGDNRAFMTGGDQLYQIDLATAETVLVGNMGTDPRGRLYNSSGDCVVDKTDALWMTSSHAATDEFVRVDADSGEAESVGETGFGGLWGLTAAYGYIFAFSSAGEIILLDERTGEGTLVHTISGVSFYGAASSPER